MEKKSLITYFILLFLIFLWLLIIGQAAGISNFSGDINLIDEGQFAAWVNHMLHGKVIYKDIYIQYGPLEIYLIYIFMRIFGSSFFIIRFVLNTVTVFLGIVVVLFALKALKVSKVIEAVIIFFIVIIPGVGIRYWIGVVNILVSMKMFKHKSRLYAIFLGLLIDISGLLTIDSAIFSVITIGIFTFYKLVVEKSVIEIFKLIIWTIIGILIGIVTFTVLALSCGFLSDYVKTTLEIITSFSGVNLPNGQGLPKIILKSINLYNPLSIMKFFLSKEILFYLTLIVLMSFISIVIIRIFQRLNSSRDTIAILILIYAFLIFTSFVGRSGHYPLIVPFIFTVGGYLLTILFENKSKEKFSASMKFFLLLCFLCYGFRYISIYRYNIFSNLYQNNTVTTVQRIAPIAISKKQASDIIELQKYFTENSKPTDTIFIVNNLPGLYFLLDRENSTIYDIPLVVGTKEKRIQLVSGLINNPPKFIIEDKNAWAVDGVTDRQRIPEVFDYIAKNYKKQIQVRSFLIYIPQK